MTQFEYYPLEKAHLAEGVVVVIDVLRAFSTAAYAFNNGAKCIYPVSSVDQAMTLRSRFEDALTMGEVDGFKPPVFDFSNSPAEILGADIKDRILIQRTSAGTQGVMRASHAEQCYAASFVVARATADYLWVLKPDLISFIITGESQGRDGDEDRACGEYIQALFVKKQTPPDMFVARIDQSTVGRSFHSGNLQYLLSEDLELCKKVDAFDFFLRIKRENDLLVMRKGTGKPSHHDILTLL